MANIRLWKLGSLEHRITPTLEGIEKLRSILDNLDNKDNLDVIWGPDIDVQCIPIVNSDNIDIVLSTVPKINEIIKDILDYPKLSADSTKEEIIAYLLYLQYDNKTKNRN